MIYDQRYDIFCASEDGGYPGYPFSNDDYPEIILDNTIIYHYNDPEYPSMIILENDIL